VGNYSAVSYLFRQSFFSATNYQFILSFKLLGCINIHTFLLSRAMLFGTTTQLARKSTGSGTGSTSGRQQRCSPVGSREPGGVDVVASRFDVCDRKSALS